jgi:hypothetical protein
MRDESIEQLAKLLGLRYRVHHIPRTKPSGERAPNRSGHIRPNKIPKKDCGHGTANFDADASAAMHAAYVRAPNWGGPEKTSYHHVVDDVEAIELLPWEEEAYHGGTLESNLYWMGMEICENGGHYGAKTLDNAAKLMACKAVKFGKKIPDWNVQHNAAYGKDCPYKLRHTPGAWQDLLNKAARYAVMLEGLLQGGPVPKPEPPPVPEPKPEGHFFNETEHYVGGAIWEEWQKHGLKVMGYPIGEEYAEGGFQKQKFENVRVRWQPGDEVRFDAVQRELDDQLAKEAK